MTIPVRIRFRLDGLEGVETYDADETAPSVRIAALCDFERELIAGGAPTWGCGCCIHPSVDVVVLDVEVLGDAND